MFLSTEGFPQAHRILGIVNATSHLAMLPKQLIHLSPWINYLVMFKKN